MPNELLEALYRPIAGDHPAGADLALTLDPDLDEIRAARKGDDGDLAQGDWVRELRAPQWPRVRELCEHILSRRSKDLQVACWYAEALTMLEGFGGLILGLTAAEGILDRFWDSCHPALEAGSAEARIARFDWLDRNLALAVKRIPLTAGGLCWLQWEEARRIDNLGLRDPQAREAALGEGHLSMEAFHRAAHASGPEYYRTLQERIQAAREQCQAFQSVLDLRLGTDGPSLDTLAEAIGDCGAAVEAVRKRFSLPVESPAPAECVAQPDPPEPSSSSSIRHRDEAIASLRAAAAFFRRAEPHSPVACLVERAAAWAEMPLHDWLAEVVKDQPTLASLRELLGMNHN